MFVYIQERSITLRGRATSQICNKVSTHTREAETLESLLLAFTSQPLGLHAEEGSMNFGLATSSNSDHEVLTVSGFQVQPTCESFSNVTTVPDVEVSNLFEIRIGLPHNVASVQHSSDLYVY